jgi:hypothetical protein
MQATTPSSANRGQVGSVEAFDVDDLVTGVARSVRGTGGAEGVEGGADAAVAGGVDKGVQAEFLRLGDQPGEVVCGPEGVPATAGGPPASCRSCGWAYEARPRRR